MDPRGSSNAALERFRSKAAVLGADRKLGQLEDLEKIGVPICSNQTCCRCHWNKNPCSYVT